MGQRFPSKDGANPKRERMLIVMTTKQITATNADELMEQREQIQTCLSYAESRQRKTEGQPMEQREQSQASLNS